MKKILFTYGLKAILYMITNSIELFEIKRQADNLIAFF